MALHWKDTLEANGFFALRDFTEWVRVVNRNVMQIILCSGYTLPEILFYSQTLSEYMWCNYRNQTDMTSYSLNFYRNASAQYDENCRYICTNNDLNMQLQYTIETLNTIHTAQDILSYPHERDVPPEKLKRDYWRVWKPMTAFVARDCLAKGSLQPLADFAEESREFNLKYLKRYMPWLLQ